MKLTKTELTVTTLAIQGLSNKGIASHLYVGRRTIEHHLSNVYLKLGIEGRNGREKRVELLKRWKYLADGLSLPIEICDSYSRFLKHREIRVLNLMRSGANCEEISRELKLKNTTVHSYRVEIYRAMELTGMQQFNKSVLVMRLNDFAIRGEV